MESRIATTKAGRNMNSPKAQTAKPRTSFPHSGVAAEPRCYLVKDICSSLKCSRRTFHRYSKAGVPFLVELLPRLGRVRRFAAEPLDRYLAGVTPIVPPHTKVR